MTYTYIDNQSYIPYKRVHVILYITVEKSLSFKGTRFMIVNYIG